MSPTTSMPVFRVSLAIAVTSHECRGGWLFDNKASVPELHPLLHQPRTARIGDINPAAMPKPTMRHRRFIAARALRLCRHPAFGDAYRRDRGRPLFYEIGANSFN